MIPAKEHFRDMKFYNHSTDSASEPSNIDITKHEIPARTRPKASFRTLFKSTTPAANVFATFANSCACHLFCTVSKSLRLPREEHFEPQKTSRDPGALTVLTSKSFSRRRGANFGDLKFHKRAEVFHFLRVLTSKSLSRAGVMQILATSTSKCPLNLSIFNDFDFQIALARRCRGNLATSTSKSAPRLSVFNDVDFQIALARRRGANFGDILRSRSAATLVFRS